MSTHRVRRINLPRWLIAPLSLIVFVACAWIAYGALVVNKADPEMATEPPSSFSNDKANNDIPLPRVITLAPHLTEWIYELGAGDQLIATVEHSDYPPQALNLPRVGNAFSLNLEKIVASRPDWVIYWADGGGALQVDRLRALGIPVLGVQINTLNELPGAVGGLCEAIRCPVSKVEAKLQERISRIQQAYANHRPVRIFIQIGRRPLWTLGGSHLLSNSLEICGAQNLFASISSPAAVVSPEQVIAGRPEVIILTKTEVDGDWEKEWNRWWPEQRSGRPRYITLHPDISLRPGPRIFDAIEIFCRRVNSE